MSCGGPLDFAARAERRRRADDDAHLRRVRDGARTVRYADRPLRRHRGTARAYRRQDLHDERDAHADLRRTRCGRKTRGAVGDRQGVSDRRHARSGDRRDGYPRRLGDPERTAQLARARVGRGADRHHRRRREYPHAFDDHLRSGRDPLPSVRAEGNQRGRGQGSEEVRCGAVRACQSGRAQWRAREVARVDRQPPRRRTAGAGHRALLPAPVALLRRVRVAARTSRWARSAVRSSGARKFPDVSPMRSPICISHRAHSSAITTKPRPRRTTTWSAGVSSYVCIACRRRCAA